MPGRGKPTKSKPSFYTSAIEGHSLGEMEVTWTKLKESEMRLRMMDTLQKIKVGFNDVESFNLGLVYTAKTVNFENHTEMDDRKVVEEAMKFKQNDEVRNRKRLVREKLKMKKKIKEQIGDRTNHGRRLLKHLNEVAEKRGEESSQEWQED